MKNSANTSAHTAEKWTARDMPRLGENVRGPSLTYCPSNVAARGALQNSHDELETRRVACRCAPPNESIDSFPRDFLPLGPRFNDGIFGRVTKINGLRVLRRFLAFHLLSFAGWGKSDGLGASRSSSSVRDIDQVGED